MAVLQQLRAETRQGVNRVKAECNKNTSDIQEMTAKQAELEKENRALKEQIGQLQDHNRRNNLIVGGIPEEPNKETWEQTEEKVRQALVTDLGLDQQTADSISIDRAQRLGKRNANGNPRVIKVHFANLKHKDSVLRKAREKKPQNSWYREDYSPEVLTARTKLKPGLIATRNTDVQAHLANDKLVVQQGNNKNVYCYDHVTKTIKSLTHSFDDGIVWGEGTVNS